MIYCIGTFAPEDLSDLLNFLISGNLSNSWYDIGVQLKVDTQRLDNIRTRHNLNYAEHEGLREMLNLRLKHQLTWDMLAMALRSEGLAAANGAKLLESDDEG